MQRQRRPRRLAAALCLSLALTVTEASIARAQARVPPTLDIVRVDTPPTLADYLEGGAAPGRAVRTFLQRDPRDLEPATESTTAYLSYDDTSFYAAFVCRVSNPAQLRARLAKREDVFADDVVGVLLDTFGDKQRAYLFYSTPLGIQADGVTAAATGDDFSFDTEWHTEGRVTPTGYVVLIAIPFKVLRFPATHDGAQHWRLALMRSIPAKDETDFWPGITNKLNGLVPQFGSLEGLSGVTPGRNIQIIPYTTFTGARLLDPQTGAVTKPMEGRAGVDAKAVIRDAITLDGTINPDFSQVESDDPQVTVNQRFEVFFPEKRPFFLENADYFNDTPRTLFFSRRVGDPQFGGRLTGKVGRWALGALVIDDQEPGREVDPSSPDVGRRAANGVFRARYDLPNDSRVGFLGTIRTFGAAANDVGAIDTRIRLGPKWFIDAQTVVDGSTDATGARTAGSSTDASVSRSGRLFTYSFAYTDASPNFHTDLGFVPRVDYRDVTNFFTLRWYPKNSPVIAFGPNSFLQATTNFAGTLEDWIVRLPFEVDLRGRTSLFGRHAFIQETIAGVRLREHEDLIQFSTEYWRWLSLSVSVNHGTRPNYFPAAGLVPFLGAFTDLAGSIDFRPTAGLHIGEEAFFSRLEARADSPGSGLIFSNPLMRTRVNYQFTREWSLRAIVDYNRVTANASLVSLAASRHAGLDLLLTWLLHPGTALYVGYTDGYDDIGLASAPVGTAGVPGGLTSTGRQIFVKASWLLRF